MWQTLSNHTCAIRAQKHVSTFIMRSTSSCALFSYSIKHTPTFSTKSIYVPVQSPEILWMPGVAPGEPAASAQIIVQNSHRASPTENIENNKTLQISMMKMNPSDGDVGKNPTTEPLRPISRPSAVSKPGNHTKPEVASQMLSAPTLHQIRPPHNLATPNWTPIVLALRVVFDFIPTFTLPDRLSSHLLLFSQPSFKVTQDVFYGCLFTCKIVISMICYGERKRGHDGEMEYAPIFIHRKFNMLVSMRAGGCSRGWLVGADWEVGTFSAVGHEGAR